VALKIAQAAMQNAIIMGSYFEIKLGWDLCCYPKGMSAVAFTTFCF